MIGQIHKRRSNLHSDEDWRQALAENGMKLGAEPSNKIRPDTRSKTLS